jgi:presenilin-like A22 family membrane protease
MSSLLLNLLDIFIIAMYASNPSAIVHLHELCNVRGLVLYVNYYLMLHFCQHIIIFSFSCKTIFSLFCNVLLVNVITFHVFIFHRENFIIFYKITFGKNFSGRKVLRVGQTFFSFYPQKCQKSLHFLPKSSILLHH